MIRIWEQSERAEAVPTTSLVECIEHVDVWNERLLASESADDVVG